MIKQQFIVQNKLGLHARAAARLASTSAQFSSKIQICCRKKLANGKSIMSLMMLAAGQGACLEVSIDGTDQDKAMHAIEQLILSGFGESAE